MWSGLLLLEVMVGLHEVQPYSVWRRRNLLNIPGTCSTLCQSLWLTLVNVFSLSSVSVREFSPVPFTLTRTNMARLHTRAHAVESRVSLYKIHLKKYTNIRTVAHFAQQWTTRTDEQASEISNSHACSYARLTVKFILFKNVTSNRTDMKCVCGGWRKQGRGSAQCKHYGLGALITGSRR